jgi:hypothetical protein
MYFAYLGIGQLRKNECSLKNGVCMELENNNKETTRKNY